MERDDERTAFAKACAYLSYNRAAEWTAHAAGVGSCLVYIALLVVLWVFADLMVFRGRLPTYHSVPPAVQSRFLDEWNKLPATNPAAALTAAGAANVVGDPLGETAVAAAAARASERGGDNERVAQLMLAGYDETRSLQLASLTASPDMDPDDLDALCAPHLASVIHQSVNVPPASLHDMLQKNHYHEVDHGLLSLVVRSHLNGEWQAPVVAWIARWNPWLWNVSPDPALALLAAPDRVAAPGGRAGPAGDVPAPFDVRNGGAHRHRRRPSLPPGRLPPHLPPRHAGLPRLGPSEAVSVFTRHVESVHDALYARMTVTFREAVKFFLLLAFALVVNVWLAVAFLLFAVLVYLIGGRISARFRRESAAATHHAAERLTVIRESLMMMRLVKTYLMEQFNQSRVERQLARYSQAQRIRHRGDAMPRPLLVLLALLCTLVLLYVAGVIVLSGARWAWRGWWRWRRRW